MKILLLTPPYPKEHIFRNRLDEVGGVTPPLGIAYIAAVLEEENYDVEIRDYSVLSANDRFDGETVEKDIEKFKPDLVGISSTSPQLNTAVDTLEEIKNIDQDITTFLGGPHVTAMPETVCEFESIDYGVKGEGEITFLEAVKALEKGKDPEEVPGVIYEDSGEPEYSIRSPLEDIDRLPMPAWNLLPMDLYQPSPAKYRERPASTMITSRGCPMNCAFCQDMFDNHYRAHSPERVASEMELLSEKYGIKDIQIFDDNFTLNKKRAMEICDLIIERNIDIRWNCLARVDTVDRELLEKMKEAGCYQVGYGIETGSNRILDLINKGFTREKARKVVEMTQDVGIDVAAFFMLGFPTETREEIEKTIEFAKELNIYVAQFMITTPFPDTELWDLAKEKGSLNGDWKNYTFFAPEKMPYKPETLEEGELSELYSKAMKEYHFRPSYMLKALRKTNSVEDVRRHLKAVRAVLSF